MMDPMLNLQGQTAASLPSAEVDATAMFASFVSVLKYCALIIVAPILTFMLAQAGLQAWSGQSGGQSGILAAVAAIVVLHLALGLFIYQAYFEGAPAKKRIGKLE